MVTGTKTVRKCYLCGHEGEDVNHWIRRHVGGEGEVPFPICNDAGACGDRLDKADQEWRRAMGFEK